MKRGIFLSTVFCLFLGLPVAGGSQDDCPDCAVEVVLSSPLDPGWRDFRPPPLAPGDQTGCHRVPFGNKKCLDCHIKDTPKVYKEWLGSKHGINSVKCATCHGDAINFRSMPDKSVCIGCHSQQVENLPPDAPVTNCAFCHNSHWFTVHSMRKYERFSVDREMAFPVPGF